MGIGRRAWTTAVAVSGTVAVAGAGLAWLSLFRARGLEPRPDPATVYADALERLAPAA